MADTTSAPWSVGVSDAKKAEANRLLERGNTHFLEKKFSEALGEYRDAVAAWDHPAIRFNIVRCLIQLDRPDEAAENLQLTLRYGAAPLEEAVYTEALAYQKLLAKQVGYLTVACRQRGVVVTLDGQQIATCPASESRRLVPGKHQLLGTGPKLLAHATEVFVTGGESQVVDVSLEPVPQNTGIRPRTYGKIALYTGGGLLAAASGIGLWALRSYRGEFPDHCTESTTGGAPLCDAIGVDRLDRARLFGDVATIVGGVGAVAVLVGAIVVWRFPAKERSVTVTPASTGASVVLRGTF